MKLLNKKNENPENTLSSENYLPVDGTYEVASGIKVTAKKADASVVISDFLVPESTQVIVVDFLPVRIGFSDDCDITLPEVPGFFHFHALVKRNPDDEKNLAISPLNSKASLYVNNAPVINKAEIRENDVITAGGWDITIKEIIKSDIVIIHKKPVNKKDEFIPTLSVPFILIIMIIFAVVGLMFSQPLATLLKSENKIVDQSVRNQVIKVFTSNDVINVVDQLGMKAAESKNISVNKTESTINEDAIDDIVDALKQKKTAAPVLLLNGVEIFAVNKKVKRKITPEILCTAINKCVKNGKDTQTLTPILTDYINGKTRTSIGNNVPINILSGLALNLIIIRLPDYINDVGVSQSKTHEDDIELLRASIADSVGLKADEMKLYIYCPTSTIQPNIWNVEYRNSGNDNCQQLMRWLQHKWISSYQLKMISVKTVSPDSIFTNKNKSKSVKRKVAFSPVESHSSKIKVIKSRGAKTVNDAGIFSPNEFGDKYRRFHPMYEGLYADDDEQIYIYLRLKDYVGKWSEVAMKTWLVNQTDGTVTPLLLTYDIKSVTENPQMIAIELPAKTLTGDFISISIDVYGSTNSKGVAVDPSLNKLFTIDTQDYGLVQVRDGSRP
jgi:hypothetical protein